MNNEFWEKRHRIWIGFINFGRQFVTEISDILADKSFPTEPRGKNGSCEHSGRNILWRSWCVTVPVSSVDKPVQRLVRIGNILQKLTGERDRARFPIAEISERPQTIGFHTIEPDFLDIIKHIFYAPETCRYSRPGCSKATRQQCCNRRQVTIGFPENWQRLQFGLNPKCCRRIFLILESI